MNLFNPQLLLSAQVALLVLVASLLAAGIAWLWCQQTSSSPPPAAAGNTELEAARSQYEKLRHELSATETQCVAALEQRDEAERQAVLRAGETRRLTDELARLKNSEKAGEDALQTAQEHADADASARLAEVASRLEQELNESRTALETKERERAEAASEQTQLRQQLSESRAALEAKELERAAAAGEKTQLRRELDLLRQAHDGMQAEVAGLKQQFAQAEALASLRQGQLEQLAKGKAEAEIALKTQIDKLLAAPAPEPAKAPAAKPIRLPRPPLPPPEVLLAPVDDNFDSFPPAPPAPERKPLGESLFDEAALTSFPPEAPSLEDARETLRRLKQELEEKDQVVASFAEEHARQREALDQSRLAGTGTEASLRAAEKSEHAAATRLADATADRDRSSRQVRALTRSLAAAGDEVPRADDLTRIKGIKGVINNQLHAFGIFNYLQIVQWDDEDMLAFSELLAFRNRIHRDNWQGQARTLMEAKYGKQG